MVDMLILFIPVDYIKGDSAYLFVTPKLSTEKLTVTSKDEIKAYILKGKMS